MKMQVRVSLVRWPHYIGRFFACGSWCLVGNAKMYVVRLAQGTLEQCLKQVMLPQGTFGGIWKHFWLS